MSGSRFVMRSERHVAILSILNSSTTGIGPRGFIMLRLRFNTVVSQFDIFSDALSQLLTSHNRLLPSFEPLPAVEPVNALGSRFGGSVSVLFDPGTVLQVEADLKRDGSRIFDVD